MLLQTGTHLANQRKKRGFNARSERSIPLMLPEVPFEAALPAFEATLPTVV
jgi:hypothetical protein